MCQVPALSAPLFAFLSNIVNACSQSHFPASTESLYASYGPRDEESLHRSVTQRSRRWNLRVSERDVLIVDQWPHQPLQRFVYVTVLLPFY
jgi:hypothetical protein